MQAGGKYPMGGTKGPRGDCNHSPDILEKFTKERVKQVGDNQETFGDSEIDAIIPLLKELVEGKARGYVLAVEFKNGTRMIHKFRPSIELVEILLDELMGMK